MTTEFSRRDMLAGTAAIGALAMFPAGARAQSGDAAANALLDSIASPTPPGHFLDEHC